MKLYGYFRSSAAYRVRIALNLKGLTYDSIPVNLLKAEHLADAFRVLNPQGRVPVLDIGEDLLLQSPAIIEYLDEVHPQPPLLPADPRSRAAIGAPAGVIGCDIHPLNNLSVLNYLKGPLGLGKEAVSAWYTHWIHQGFAALEAMIEPGPFAFGAHPTIADIYLVPQVYNARRFGVAMDAYPKLAAVDEACARLDAFRNAAPDRQPDAA